MDGFSTNKGIIPPRWLWPTILLLVAAIWFAWCCQRAIAGWLPAADEGREITVTGHVLDFPRRTERGWQFDFHAEELGGKLRLSVFEETGWDAAPSFSCRYRFSVKLRRPRGLLNFGQFDYQAWLLQAGYRATGYVKAVAGCEPLQPAVLLRSRAWLATWIRSAPLSERASSTLLGLLIGSYADIDVQQWQVLRDSGTIHLLSVSGLHIVLVAALVHLLASWLARLLVWPLHLMPAAHWGCHASLVLATAYALLAGFSVATQRSLVMVAVAVLQQLVYGRFRFGTALLVSLVAVYALNPLSILSSGFWFSFVATAVLLLASHGWRHAQRLGFWQQCLSGLRLQGLLFVLMAPVLLFVYGRMPLLSLPLNLLAVPWVSFVSLPAGFAAVLVLPLSTTLAGWLLQLSGWTLDLYWQVMQWGIGLGEHWQWSLGGAGWAALCLAMMGLYLLCLAPSGLPLRLAGCLLCLPMLLPRGIGLSPGEVEVTVLDVGQGLSVIVRTARHVLVYDTGDRSSERFDAGRDIVAPALRQQRVAGLDMLLLSHADSDHAGGAAGLLQEYPARQLWSGTPESLQGVPPFLPCRAGMHWRWDGVSFRILHPDSGTLPDDNNRSCVLQVEAGEQRLLLAGDIEQRAEQQLAMAGIDLRADVLLMPHHGSKTSSSPALLSAVRPSLAIASAGYRNRFHHPAVQVTGRYEIQGIRWLNTAETGAIRLRLSAAGMEQTLALCQAPVPWRWARYRQYCRH